MLFPICPFCKRQRKMPCGPSDKANWEQKHAKWTDFLLKRNIKYDFMCLSCIIYLARYAESHKLSGDYAIVGWIAQKLRGYQSRKAGLRKDRLKSLARPPPICIDCSVIMPGAQKSRLRCDKCKKENHRLEELKKRKSDPEYRAKQSSYSQIRHRKNRRIKCAACTNELPIGKSSGHRKFCTTCYPLYVTNSRWIRHGGGPDIPKGKCESCGENITRYANVLAQYSAHWCKKCRREKPTEYHRADYEKRRDQLLRKRNCVGCGLQLAGTHSSKWCPDCWKKEKRRIMREYYHRHKPHDNA